MITPEHYRLITRYVNQFMKNWSCWQEKEDVIQEACLMLLEYPPDSYPNKLLRKVAKHAIYHWAREVKRLAEVSFEFCEEAIEPAIEATQDVLLNTLQLRSLVRKSTKFTALQLSAIDLYFFQGYSNDDVIKKLNRGRSATQVMYQAYGILRTLIKRVWL